MASVLEGVRVLELAGEPGELCGKLLAGMGADVLKVEPPGGCETRSIGPFYRDEPHPDRSLHFWHHNVNKRGVTCNLETPEGRELFKRLAEDADIVLETFRPGYLDSLGLGYAGLSAIAPGLVLTSITPFGQTGPYAHWKGSDLIGLATGGTLNVCGYEDHSIPPIRGDGNQAYNTACVEAAIGTMSALLYGQATGIGQHVDVSVQDCMAITVEFQNLKWMYGRKQVLRQAGRHAREVITMPSTLLTANGTHLLWSFRLDDQKTWKAFVDWSAESGYAPDLASEEYLDPHFRLANAEMIIELVHGFIGGKTAREAFEEGQRYDQWIAPINAPEDLVDDPQFVARDYYRQVEHPELGESFAYTGAPWLFHASPWSTEFRAPLLGEHNRVVYGGELGIGDDEIEAYTKAGAI